MKADIPEKGFYFDPVKHKYYLDGKLMTGTTTCLGVLAKPAQIQWSANLSAAEAYSLAADMEPDKLSALRSAIAEAAIKFGKINAQACYAIEAEFPEFKEARLAHNKKKEAAGQHGTDTHLLIESYINHCLLNGATPAQLEVEEIVQPFVDWSVANVKEFLFAERAMHDPDLFFAGTADFAYVGVDGRRYIGDFKTSSGIYGIDYWLQVAAYRHLAEKEGDALYDGMTVVRIGKDDGKFEAHSLYEYESYRDVFLSCVRIYRMQQGHEGMTVKAY